MNKKALLTVLTLIALGRMCEGQERRTTPEDTQPGVVTSSSRGLHGYIGYSATRPSDPAEYGAGMGFYSAVWPLIREPLAGFQIGLAGTWITPDNRDNK
ncbi:MAG TPA: hypothetical protein PLT20_10660, partial [Sedimentisphaerales bacterium]|nr:hypothetical protein [Sedimentisphaerales bacterium]